MVLVHAHRFGIVADKLWIDEHHFVVCRLRHRATAPSRFRQIRQSRRSAIDHDFVEIMLPYIGMSDAAYKGPQSTADVRVLPWFKSGCLDAALQ